jgi:succinate dehydrogenase hydrophobic anchor subunit
MSIFLLPVVIYGLMVLGQRFPKSEASDAGVSYSSMFLQLFAPLMLLLLFLHSMVGYVELGTDSWIGNITGSIMKSPQYGLMLFVYTSGLMFIMRFFAGPIVHKISPLGLLFVSGLLGFVGLQLLSRDAESFGVDPILLCVVAATIYACGKTFLWPTMLAVASERFPKGGAITIGAVGGFGMLSAGLLGGPGIGFKQDYFATTELKEKSMDAYDRYKSDTENQFLFGTFKVAGLDGQKVGVLQDDAKDLKKAVELKEEGKRTDDNLVKLSPWWEKAEATKADDKKVVDDVQLYGGRMALRVTSFVPLVMAGFYLLLILIFKASGGYKAVSIEETTALGTAES